MTPSIFSSTAVKFILNPTFVADYATRKPPFGFNGLGELVYLRTYSRLREDDTKEQWHDTVERVVNGVYSMQKRWILAHRLPWSEAKAQRSAQEMFDRIWNMKFLPPGRGLWAMGSPLTEERGLHAALFNCAFCSTEHIDTDLAEPFAWLMDASMLGIGVGFDVRGAEKVVVRAPDNRAEFYTIPDTREGWVESVRRLINSYLTAGPTAVFDYSEIRPAGLPIKGFGGISSGYEPLEQLHTALREVLDTNVGRPITVTTIVDTANLIGKCVVAGNVRRCLPKGTLVHTDAGLIPIEKLRPGMRAKTSEGYAEISELVPQGVQDVWAVDTQLGEFRATARHQMAVMTAIGSYEWKKLSDLQVGDRLVFVQNPTEGHTTRLPTWSYDRPARSTTCKDITIPELDDNIGWLLGLMQGDGYVYANHAQAGFNAYVSIACSSEKPEIIDKASEQLRRFGTHVMITPRSKERCTVVRTQSKQLAWYLHEHLKQPNAPLRVPSWILTSTPEVRAAFVAGVFDADGSCSHRPLVAVCSVYPEFVRDVQAVLASLGIPSRMRIQRKERGTWQELWRLSIVGETALINWNRIVAPHSCKYTTPDGRFRSGYDYGYPAQWVRDAAISYSNSWDANAAQMTTATAERCGVDIALLPVEVLDVRANVATVDTYDIAVPSAQEFVVQEGLLVHNTALLALGETSDEYLNLKDYTVNPHRESYGWTSNNSIEATLGQSYQQHAKKIEDNGEPGFLWLQNMQRFGRMGEVREDKAIGANPCVVGSTPILTRSGWHPIESLVGTEVEIWNGFEWSAVVPAVTGYNEPVITVEMSNGRSLTCTPAHTFVLSDDYKGTTSKKSAAELVAGDRLIKTEWPVVSGGESVDPSGAYTQGFVAGDGMDGYDKLWVYETKYDCIERLSGSVVNAETFNAAGIGRRELQLSVVPHPKSFVPFSWNVAGRLSWLAGLFDADGCVCSDGQVQVVSADADFLLDVQLLLTTLGVASKVRPADEAGPRDLPNGRGGYDTYQCQATKRLLVNSTQVQHLVSLGLTTSRLVLDHVPNRDASRYVTVERTIDAGVADTVYCFTEPKRHLGAFNGVVTGQCGEVQLESYELCNICETFPANHESLDDYKRTLKFAYLYAKTVTLSTTPWPQTNRVMLRNRRVGVSMSGIQQAVASLGLETFRTWCETGYATLQYYDKVYSDWLAIPRSIRLSTVKPSGTVSLLAGATPGVHWPEARTYIRRMRLSKYSDLLPALQSAGYPTEPAFEDENTVVVEIPVHIDENVRTAKEVSMWEQLAMGAFMQRYWSDQMVSQTITFDPDREAGDIEKALQYAQYQLKSVSFLPRHPAGAYRQMPYEAISITEYAIRAAQLQSLFFDSHEDAKAEMFCNNDTCEVVK